MRPNFTECGLEFFSHSTTLYSKYIFNGSTSGIGLSDNSTSPILMTWQGCRQICGTGVEYYTWREASNTITTWVLPIIGLLVQAPFESNQAWQTVLALCRWVGNPIAALSYIFWNIKVTRKCALMVDMATRYDEYPGQGSEFSRMRDSLFILSIMNQYATRPSLPPIEAERLLRLALFSNMLSIDGSNQESLVNRRTEIAQAFREGRKKGVVPVFVSFLWFVFAMALSVQLAFDDIGGNATAHNLAVGLLVGWLPILILASTVDRNLVSSDSIQNRLNLLVDDVRLALLNPEVLETYMTMTNTTFEDFTWTGCLNREEFREGFFTKFAGQGRTHWHYGVAHPLLAGIEAKFMAEYGRDWLRHGHAARMAIVVGSRNVNGLKMFDARMVWQITSALIIVGGSVGGAFILSYFTPTAGLGCRSGGYLIYLLISLVLLTAELSTWWLTHTTTHTPDDLLARVGKKLEHHRSFQPKSSLEAEGQRPAALRAHAVLHWFRSTAFRDVIKNWLLRPAEVINTGWLAYIIFAQTFGAYQTCDCMAKMWTGIRFLDFQAAEHHTTGGVYKYWSAATGLSLTVLIAGLVYIVEEYCTQSHLSTEDYSRAMQGLRVVRVYKKYTRWVRSAFGGGVGLGKWVWWKVSGGRSMRGRRSLMWKEEEGRRRVFIAG